MRCLSVERDVVEGADILMVKPGLPYLDILASLSQQFAQPWAVYEVSGEYAAIELLAREGLTQRVPAHLEAWTALRARGRIDDHHLRRARSARNGCVHEPLGRVDRTRPARVARRRAFARPCVSRVSAARRGS